jgi:hypothetical protein
LYRKKTCAIIGILCVCLLSVVAIQPLLIPQSEKLPNPKFIISSWSFPDEYGQGIDALGVYENSTGSWLAINGGFVPTVDYNDEASFEWNASLGIKIRVYCWVNSSLSGFGSVEEGKNYLKHTVIVTQINGTIVFSQENFTYFNAGAIDEMYEYDYDVVLNFLPEMGEIYRVSIILDIYW